MRCRLRTLIIVLAIGPMVLAGSWIAWQRYTTPRKVWRNVDGPGPDELEPWMLPGYVPRPNEMVRPPTDNGPDPFADKPIPKTLIPPQSDPFGKP